MFYIVTIQGEMNTPPRKREIITSENNLAYVQGFVSTVSVYVSKDDDAFKAAVNVLVRNRRKTLNQLMSTNGKIEYTCVEMEQITFWRFIKILCLAGPLLKSAIPSTPHCNFIYY